jgi:hypothetical protein
MVSRELRPNRRRGEGLRPGDDPFAAMVNKDVSMRIFGSETIEGRSAEVRAGYVLVTSPGTKQRYWVNKSHVS